MEQQNNDWMVKNDCLTKRIKLTNFDEVVGLIVQLQEVANGMNHHPDFKVENYNEIEFNLSTHDTGSVSEKDYLLAAKIDGLIELIKK